MTNLRRWAAALLISAGTLAACSSGTSTTSPATTPTQAPSGMALTVTSSGSTSSGPSAGGINSTITLPAATGGAGSTIALGASTALPSGAPTPSSVAREPRSLGGGLNILFYLTFTPSASVTFTGYPGFTFSLTPNASVQYFVALFDPTNAGKGFAAIEGPGTVSGSNVSFNPATTPVTLNAGQTYVFLLYSLPVANATPTPSPGASATPSPVPSATPSTAPSAAPTASPSAAPTATPATGIVLTTKSLAFLQTGQTEIVSATETGYTGAFAISNNTCSGIVNVSQPSGGTFSVTSSGVGACSFGISDTNNNTATVSVSSTTTNIGGQ